MSEIVNLRRARKAKARAEAGVKAAANRAAFGISSAERLRAQAQARLLGQRLEGHSLVKTPPDDA